MMTEEISDVLLLFAYGVLGLLVLLVWLAVAFGLAVLIGRIIRRADAEEQRTVELALLGQRTDTVLMERVPVCDCRAAEAGLHRWGCHLRERHEMRLRGSASDGERLTLRRIATTARVDPKGAPAAHTTSSSWRLP